MASFTKNIKCKYGLSTYEEVKNTYEWIIKSIKKLNYENSDVKEQFQFHIGDISCVANSYSEYVENCYGVSDFEFISIMVNIYHSNDKCIYITNNIISNECLLRITADNKSVLEKVCNSLLDTELNELQMVPAITYIATQNNNNTEITGDNSIVVNQSENVDITNTKKKKEESTINQWLRAIAQNLLSNWIGYLLALLAGSFVNYLISNY